MAAPHSKRIRGARRMYGGRGGLPHVNDGVLLQLQWQCSDKKDRVVHLGHHGVRMAFAPSTHFQLDRARPSQVPH